MATNGRLIKRGLVSAGMLVLLFLSPLQARDDIQISLLTCSKGDLAYNTFGHTALRVIDHRNGHDLVYNFGLFEFDTPCFHTKFLSGGLQYHLGIHHYLAFISLYQTENRSVWEQKLRLPAVVKKALVDTLNKLHLPAHRYYSYAFLEKNCTSKVRDVLFHFLSGSSQFANTLSSTTYRQMLNDYLNGKPWLCLGINLITGSSIDRTVTRYQQMALPNTLMASIDTLTYNDSPLVESRMTVISRKPPEKSMLNFISPFWVLTSLLLMYLVFGWRPLSYIALLMAATVGLIVMVLWTTSMHSELQQNINVLWANPLYLLFCCLNGTKWPQFRKYLAVLLLVFTSIAMLLWISGFQLLPLAAVPLMIHLALFNLSIIWGNNRVFTLKNVMLP